MYFNLILENQNILSKKKRLFSGTARDEIYFEQQFIVTSALDRRLRSTIYTRLTERTILTWIQDITGNLDV